MIDLGPYADRVRLWLRGEKPFPEHMALAVFFAQPGKCLIALQGPGAIKPGGWHRFWSYIHGISFTLHVGRTIDRNMREGCFYSSPDHPVIMADYVNDTIWNRLKEQYRESRKSQSYLAGLETRKANQ
jgi:hypothetical protein